MFKYPGEVELQIAGSDFQPASFGYAFHVNNPYIMSPKKANQLASTYLESLMWKSDCLTFYLPPRLFQQRAFHMNHFKSFIRAEIHSIATLNCNDLQQTCSHRSPKKSLPPRYCCIARLRQMIGQYWDRWVVSWAEISLITSQTTGESLSVGVILR